MQTKTIGEILRSEREFHHLSIDDLAKRTRIRREYLLSLEANRFTQLPAAAFVKGYIKTYGQVFGFDHQPLLAMLRRDYKESARGNLVPREFIKPVLKRRWVWAPTTVVFMLLSVAVMVVASYVGWQWYVLQRPPEVKLIEPVEGALVGPQVIISGQTSPEAQVLVNTQPVQVQLDGSFATEIFMPREGINTVTIEAIDRRGKSRLEQRTVRVEF